MTLMFTIKRPCFLRVQPPKNKGQMGDSHIFTCSFQAYHHHSFYRKPLRSCDAWFRHGGKVFLQVFPRGVRGKTSNPKGQMPQVMMD